MSDAVESTGLEVADFSPARATMRTDVLRGLRGTPKALPTAYLYDERGSHLFDQITHQPEYYLTRTEVAIMRQNMPQIAAAIGPQALVIEPGSGSGVKTELLLTHLVEPAAYVPLDISCDHLERAAQRLNEQFPPLTVLPVCADFFGEFELPECPNEVRKRVMYFPGSTIGNMSPEDAVGLLRRLAALCGASGGLLIGVDLKKDAAILEPAYDDAAGVSAAFALNYLVRLNRELGADFDLAQFDYEAPYDAANGRIEMVLVSRVDQTGRIGGQSIRFAAGERCRTEWSYKYSPEEFAALAAQAGWQVEHVWLDDHRLFSVQYLSHAGA